jgi:RHS repeat-associated protein
MAMRTGATTLNWLLGDHLGSTNITADAGGNKTGELRYKPWGEVRYGSIGSLTTFKFTGQRAESALGGSEGLYYYGARFYDPSLGRFASPDSVIPDPGNPQSWDRFAYSSNNPVNYTDPTGHMAIADGDQGPNLKQSYNAIEEALIKNHRTWDQLPEGYKDVLKRAGYNPATFDQTELAKNGATDVSWSLEDPFNQAYLLFSGVTVGLTAGISRLIAPSVTTCVAIDCVDKIQSGITVLGYSEDVEFYTGVNVNVLHNVADYTWEGTNIPFLDDAMARGDTFVFVSDFLEHPFRTFPREVHHILEAGYDKVVDLFSQFQ